MPNVIWEYAPTICVGEPMTDPCKNAPTLAVDVSSEYGQPAWTTVAAACEGCYDNIHRGGFVHAKPLAEVL